MTRTRVLRGLAPSLLVLATIGCGDADRSSSTESVAVERAGGIDTDEPCTATRTGAPLRELGIGLHEVAAMTFDPSDEVDPAEGVWTYESMFVDNAELGFQWSAGCDLAVRLGRVTGHQQSVTNYDLMQESLGTPQVLSLVHVFQTEEGAAAYADWVTAGDDPWPCPFCNGMSATSATVTDVTTEELADAGPDARVVRLVSDLSDRAIAVVRKGLVVGEVQVIGPPGGLPDADIAALGQRAWAQIDSAELTGEPYDATAVMSAPLTLAEWGDAYDGMVWDVNYAGGRDTWEFVQMSPDPDAAAADVEALGRLVAFQANYVGAGEPPMWIATGVTVYPSEASARAALDDVVADRIDPASGGEPAETFEVPGVDGAVGLVRLTDGELVTEVFLPYGATVGRAYIIRQGGPAEDPATDDRPEVLRVVQQWIPRLQEVLGAAG